MAYFACGRSMSTSVAPLSRSTSSAASNAATTLASTPSDTNARGTPTRTPARCRSAPPRSRAPARVPTSSRIGSGPAITDSASAASSTVRANGSDLIERRGKGQQAVARDAAVGRLQPDDAAERRRLTDRSAGVGAERERHACRPRRPPPTRRSIRRACGRAPTGCAPGRTPSSRSTSPSRTRRSSSCRRSRRRRPRAAVTSWRRRAARRCRGS